VTFSGFVSCSRRSYTRRRLLTVATALLSGVGLAACGGASTTVTASVGGATTSALAATSAAATTTAAGTAAVASTSAAMATASTTATSAAQVATTKAAASTAELKVAQGIEFTSTLDARKNAFQLIRAGVGETLTRLTTKSELVPWLAQAVTNVDPSTWRVTLRPNAKFWDGSPVTAQDVSQAFQDDWKAYGPADGLLSKKTTIKVVDAATLEFTTPAPIGNFANAISAQFFIIHKGGTVMTGAYRPTGFQVGQQLTLAGFADHWGGPPPYGKITIKDVTDANARVLALQSGDVDLIDSVPPQSMGALGSGFWVVNVPAGREDYIVLNHRNVPFNDSKVCLALSYGVDRQQLLTVGLTGVGAVAGGIFPDGVGMQTIPMQSTDPAQTKSILDAAGWTTGSDGIRAKGGARLAFTLITAGVRPEWTPMAVAIQQQLKPAGFEVKIQQVQNVGDVLSKDTTFQAAMYSAAATITGDPVYFLNQTLLKGAPANYGAYDNSQINDLIAKMEVEVDAVKRQDLSVQVQQIAKTDAPNIYMVRIPVIAAGKKSVAGYVPNPNDPYFITNEIHPA
jgi:peptide/nickel transport system substrate-binding protein